MLRSRGWVVTVALLGCASSPPPAAAPPVTASASPAPIALEPSAPPSPPAAPAEPSAEEKKKEADAREFREDRARWEADKKAEQARWTPELHTAAKAVADKKYPNGRAALQAALHGPQRKPSDVARDPSRHPLETLEFFGFKPTMTVLDVGPGDGWYTSILAPALYKQGLYVATTSDPSGAGDERATFNGQRFRAFLDAVPEAFGRAQTIVVDSKAPKLDKDSAFDLVIVMRGIHGFINGGTLGPWLTEIHRALKPGGILGIEQHRALADADPVASAKKGYVPEKWLVEQVEAAGFTLAGKSEINANPKDTKDYSEGVWALPPTFRLGDKDHEKYAAIGESDRMTLKFVKKASK
jgi:predicted methyltransferase